MKFAAFAVALVAVASAVSCGGSSAPPGPLPQVSKAAATRDVTDDGAAKTTSTIVVDFDRPFELAASALPLSSQFELQVSDPTKGKDATKRVLVAKADYKTGSRTVTLSVNSLIPDGSTLKVSNKAFRKDDTTTSTATVSSDMSLAAVLLATVPLTTSSDTILNAATIPPVKPGDSDVATQRAALQAVMKARGANDATTTLALQRFDAMSPDIVPSPKARAALAALTGTFADPAIDYLMTGSNCTGKPVAKILFQPPPDEPDLLARMTFTADGQRVLSLNPELEGDRIEHIMPFLAHEPIHCDDNDTLSEEVVATGFDTFLYLQLIAADPSIVTSSSPAGRELDIDAIAMINSGRRFPESVGLLQSAGFTVALPGTNAPYASFADLVVRSYPNVPNSQPVAEPLADAYITRLATAAGIQPQSGFDVRYIDALLGSVMSPQQMAADMAALDLVPA